MVACCVWCMGVDESKVIMGFSGASECLGGDGRSGGGGDGGIVVRRCSPRLPGRGDVA